MAWVQLHLVALRGDVERVEDALLALGSVSITLGDQHDVPILEPGVGETPLWPELRVSALFERDCDQQSIERQLIQRLGGSSSDYLWEVLEDRAWEREWLQHFKPTSFGTRLWVAPVGAQVDAANAAVLQLDPGLAFGTGTHPSTALCLEWLDANPPCGLAVVDFGCGSGILGIAALLLGAKHVNAVDIDPQALTATRENAARNNIDPQRLCVNEPKCLEGVVTDLLLANILAGPLIELAPRFAGLLRNGGHAVLAGVLDTQADAVCSAYAPWFDVLERQSRDEWCRIDLLRTPGEC